MDAPIFIVGANRSGTTLLRLILNAHSRIAIPDELVYITPYVANVGIYAWRDPGMHPSYYASFVRNFLQGNAEVLSPLDLDALAQDITTSTSPNLRSPYQMALEAWADHHGKQRWGEKTPSNIFYADAILDMFPDAHFIHVIRDPRGGVASMQGVKFFADDVALNALNRKKYLTEGQDTLEQHVPSRQRTVVRYEDLVREPKATMRCLCDFLSEPFEPSMLRFYEDSERYMRDEATRSFNAAATHPISPAKIDEWKDRLSPQDVGIVESICRQQMKAYNYDLAMLPLSLTTKLEVLFKTAYWHWQMWRNRHIKHYLVKHRIFARTKTRSQQLANSLSYSTR